jgi:hypothetical protein
MHASLLWSKERGCNAVDWAKLHSAVGKSDEMQRKNDGQKGDEFGSNTLDSRSGIVLHYSQDAL